jgi:hypothetical protein
VERYGAVQHRWNGLKVVKGAKPAPTRFQIDLIRDGVCIFGHSRRGQFIVQTSKSDVQHTCELLLFGEDYFADAVGVFGELWVGCLHLVTDGVHHLEHEGLLLAEEASMADASAEDFAEDVAAALVGGLHAVGDEEGGGAGVVGDDAQGGRTLGVAERSASNLYLAVAHFGLLDGDALLHILVRHGRMLVGRAGVAGELGCAFDQRRKQVGLVVGDDALQDAADALESHARVDGGLGQRGERAIAGAVELHEDEVPDLHVALVVLAEGYIGSGL